MHWSEKADIFSDVYGGRGHLYGLDSLNVNERAFFCVRPFAVEMTNGGFWAFFYNSTGEFSGPTINALSSIGATVSASLLSQARAAYFGTNAIPADLAARRRLLDAVDGDHTPEADRLTTRYYELNEPLEDLLAAYAAVHVRQLRLTDAEAVTSVMLGDDWRQCTKCWDAWQESPAELLARCPSCQSLTVIRGPRQPGYIA